MASEDGVWIGEANPTLDPNDPFERVLIEMVNLSRRKAHDYAAENDRFSNFRETADHMDLDPIDSCDLLIATKQARLKQLRRKGDPANESLRDTYIDRAVYSVIAVALFDEPIQSLTVSPASTVINQYITNKPEEPPF